MLTIAIGTPSSRAAIDVIRSKAPSGGVSSTSNRRTAAMRRASAAASNVSSSICTRLPVP
jgi:hypothetical protein